MHAVSIKFTTLDQLLYVFIIGVNFTNYIYLVGINFGS